MVRRGIGVETCFFFRRIQPLHDGDQLRAATAQVCFTGGPRRPNQLFANFANGWRRHLSTPFEGECDQHAHILGVVATTGSTSSQEPLLDQALVAGRPNLVHD